MPDDDMHMTSPTPKKPRRQSSKQQVSSASRVPLSPQKVSSFFKSGKAVVVEQSKTIEPPPTFAEIPCPNTPRHRGAIKKPVTPRHRVSIIGKPITPRSGKLFSTPTKVAATPTVLTTAKTLFSRCGDPGRLIGRDEERKQLAAFLGPRLGSRSGGCLYVSGPPGCGKSALLTEVMGDLGADKADNVRKAYVNCMTMKDPKGIYVKLLEEFYTDECLSSPSGMEELEALFTPKKKPAKGSNDVFVVILDEIDHLLTKDQEVLYSIFEWSLVRNSRLILLGIANALDLTDRFLPRLKARNLTPQLLPFHPYTAPQIAAVITNRLRSLLPQGTATPGDFVPFMHPAAIQLAARKIATSTGDLRKAFDICRRAVELVESETRQKEATRLSQIAETENENSPQFKSLEKQMPSITSPGLRAPLIENMNINSPRRPSSSVAPFCTLTSMTIETAPRVMLSHIARISSASFGGSTISRVKTLNLQQKAVLCVLVTTEKNRGSVTIRQLFEAYTAVCKRERQLNPLSSTEFRDVVTSLEVSGVISGVGGGANLGTPSKKGKPGDEGRISACVREMDLVTAVADVGPILTRLFSGM